MKYYSIYDSQCGRYLGTGKNSATKQKAINDGIEYWLSDGLCTEKEMTKIRNMSFNEKEELLNSNELLIKENLELIEENF